MNLQKIYIIYLLFESCKLELSTHHTSFNFVVHFLIFATRKNKPVTKPFEAIKYHKQSIFSGNTFEDEG
jgi:hypothetical protein